MALLGYGGILELSREWPEPMALAREAINYTSSPRTISLGNEDYWTGDRVLLRFPDGSPYGNSPGGTGMYYGGIYELSAAKQHVTALDDQYYQANDAELFYDNSTPDFTASGYIRIDQLGRIRLFGSEIGAHNLIESDEIALKYIETGNFVLARYSSNSTYVAAVISAANTISVLTLPSDSQELNDVITVPAGFAAISGSPDERGWLFQADLREWAFDIDAANLDMTAIGETFGENTKAVVRGAGTLQFLIDHKTSYQGQDTTAILRLVLLTQQYCKTSAKFYLYKDRSDNLDDIKGAMYYECNLLLTNSKVNIRFDESITGSADFVATGQIGLRISN